MRIRKYSILWFAKSIGTIAICVLVVLAMGMGDAPPEPPEAAACMVYAEEPEEVSKEPATEPELTVQEQIEMECEKCGVDAGIAVAIARVETGHFTSQAFTEGNNVGGMSVNERPIAFDTLDDGVTAFVDCLAWYQADGLETVEEIGKRWCPANYEAWVSLVNQMMEEGRCIG